MPAFLIINPTLLVSPILSYSSRIPGRYKTSSYRVLVVDAPLHDSTTAVLTAVPLPSLSMDRQAAPVEPGQVESSQGL